MKKTLQLWWTPQAARIDGLSLRERAFLFITLIACCLGFADVVWLSPAQLQHTQVTQRFAAQNSELARLRDDLGRTAVPEDVNQALRTDLATETTKLQALEQQIQAIAPQSAAGPALEQVLLQFLKRQERLTLLGVRTFEQGGANAVPTNAASTNPSPANTLAAMAGVPPGAAAQPARVEPAPSSSFGKRGVELRLSGSYAELVRYTHTLETALPGLRWGRMQLKADKGAPVLTLEVFLLMGAP